MMALLTSAGLLACSASGDDLASSAQGIAGGDEDVSHQNVFLLVLQGEDFGGLCTATLIAPNLLLTARHCVSPGDHEEVLCGESLLGEPYPAATFFATNAAQPRRDSEFFRAVDVRVPVETGDTCGYDIALIVLGENVPSELSVPAVPRIDREVVPGEPYTAVGYGVNEDGDSTGSRMQRDGLNIECQPGSCGAGVESTEFLGDTGICSGDSGGPALDADGKVVGVVSRGGPNCTTPIYGTVTAWRDFLVETAAEAAVLGGYEAPFWVTTGLSDPPELPSGAGGAGGAGGADAGPVPFATEGESCADGVSCQTGLLCYSPSSDPALATCVAECAAASECSPGQECIDIGSTSICQEPRGGADQSGCSVSMRAPGSLAFGAWLAALGLAALVRRGRRSAA